MRSVVAVAGLPRSGTSWIAKALSFAPGFTYYREPDNFDHVPAAEPHFRWLYLRAGDHDEAYVRQMQRALAGQERQPEVMAEDLGPILGRLPTRLAWSLGRRFPTLYLPRPGVLLKLVFSNLSLDWLSAAAPDIRIVPVLRHPCGTYGSWARLGWSPEPQRLLADERLMADHLAPYGDVIGSARGFWERAGAEWGAIAYVLSRQLATHPDWVPVQHEWLCGGPVERMRALYAALGFEWVPGAGRFLEAHDQPGSRTHSLRRSARAEIDKWKHELDADEIRACRRVVERFPLPWYPDFEPVVADPAWA